MTETIRKPSGREGATRTAETRPPKTAFIVSQFPETHETFILREFDALADMGLDFVIMSLKPCRDRIIQTAAKRFLDRTYYPKPGPGPRGVSIPLAAMLATKRSLPWLREGARSLYISWAAGRFAALARELGVGHIHAHWATAPTSAAVLMSQILGVPYSFTAHAWDIYRGDGKLAEKARGARFVVTCTAANVETLHTVVPRDDWGKVILNYHGIPGMGERRATEPRRADGPLRIAAVGRLVETKGFGYLLDALAEADFPFELTIAGEGPLRGKLEASAAREALAGRVRLAGAVPNERIFELLRASDCFVMPSVVAKDGDRDGIPNVMLEAMSVGLPVVASNISGIPEAVADGETGLLVRERDPRAILAALGRINADRAAAREMGERGRLRALKRFSAEANAAALYDIFRRHTGGAAL